MSELVGRTLGHYRIVEQIGAGGMGVVYRARDERLDRDVAIKVLPESVAQDPERLARFEREAKLLAALNHQNIAMVFGVEEHEGGRFLLMELVEGQTLDARIAAGDLTIDDAIDIARQIAEGLDEAHERGIIHRDLKPANVMLSSEGVVKILDFGLAKPWRSAAGDGEHSHSPTITALMTEPGVVMGTAAYMSPEQARGQPVDRRTDIWAFGCILFEMLTGRQAFGGETVPDTMAKILERGPDLSALPKTTPGPIRRLLSQCLRKDPRSRLRDIGDVCLALEEWDLEEPRVEERAPKRVGRPLLPWIIAAAAVLCSLGVVVMNFRPAAPSLDGKTRLAVSLSNNQRLAIGNAATVAVSPNGSHIVYSASDPPGSRPRLWIRALDRFDADPIPGSQDGVGPFFSPDGQWLGYFVGSKLVKLFIDGGTPEEICHVGQVVPGATWGRDDSIIFTASPNSGLVWVSASGGTPERLTTPDYAKGESSHGWPRFLPGDQHVIFTVSSGKGTHIAVLGLENGEIRRLVRGLGGAYYLSSGHLIFAQSEGLVAVAFDPVSLEVSGSPVLVLEDVYTIPASWGFGLSAFSVSDDGLLAYLPGGTEAGTNRLVWVDRNGKIDLVSGVSGIYEWPRLSPDGSKIAVSNRTSDNMVGVWVLDVERDTRSRLAAERMSILPTWTPDGERLVFSSQLESRGVVNVFLKRADGTGEAHHILKSEHDRFPRSWSPDGRQLALTEWNPDTMRDIWVLTVDRSPGAELQFNTPTPLITTAADEFGPAFSPAGRWLAYVSDESGHYEVYVQSFPAGRGRWLISSGGGLEPIWSPDGTELFYRNGDVMMRVPVRSGDEFHADAPEVLFERRLKRGIYDSLSYDITPDGTRFLMIQRNLEYAPNELRVVHDWREELRQRVPPTTD